MYAYAVASAGRAALGSRSAPSPPHLSSSPKGVLGNCTLCRAPISSTRHIQFFLIQFLFIYSGIDFKVATRGFWQHIYHLFLLYSGTSGKWQQGDFGNRVLSVSIILWNFWEVATGDFWQQVITRFYYIPRAVTPRIFLKKITKISKNFRKSPEIYKNFFNIYSTIPKFCKNPINSKNANFWYCTKTSALVLYQNRSTIATAATGNPCCLLPNFYYLLPGQCRGHSYCGNRKSVCNIHRHLPGQILGDLTMVTKPLSANRTTGMSSQYRGWA